MHKRNKLGLSLVELIVAMSILSIGIVFILRSFLNTISALDTSIYYIKSMNVLQIKAAELELETAVSGGIEVKEGIFGANMEVSLTNDGPVTIWLDSNNR